MKRWSRAAFAPEDGMGGGGEAAIAASAVAAEAEGGVDPGQYGSFGLEEGEFADEDLGGFRDILARHGLERELGAALGSDLATFEKQRLVRMAASARDEQSAAWIAEARADRVFGGARLTQTLADAAKAIDAFGGADAGAVRALLDETGLGNHPALVRLFARAGRAASEDGPMVRGDRGRAASAAELLYPTMKKGV